MATLVLGVVGTVLGGPFGGAIGALIGQQVDQNILFKPKGREGPRLQDLAVQTSQYGAQFARVYGKMRVAGTVIWATDLQETRVREGGGKGRPGTTRYSYSASFAVALSSRPVSGIGRIWADGNIIRGSNGDFSLDTGFRLYQGFGDQPLDPLIASAEGPGNTPAYRGLAYAVFEDMPLEEFGNHIPSLTFEVFADQGPVELVTIIKDVVDEAELSFGAHSLTGVALSGASRRDALEMIAAGFPLTVAHRNGRIAIASIENADEPVAASLVDLDILSDPQSGNAAIGSTRASMRTNSGTLNLRYYDPERDYQPGLRRSSRTGPGKEIGLEFPAVLNAQSAQARVDSLSALAMMRRDSLAISTMVADQAHFPGNLLSINGVNGVWRVKSWSWTGERVEMELQAFALPGARPLDDVASGRAVTAPDFVASPTIFAAFDLPSLFDTPSGTPRILLAMNSPNSHWRGAQLLAADASGNPAEPIQYVRDKSILGVTQNALPAASALMFDRRNSIEVQLVDHQDVLLNATVEDLLAGANLAAIGGELIQFAQAQYLGGGLYRLSTLLRGRGGTEDAMDHSGSGEPFVLIDAVPVLLDQQAGLASQTLKLFALGVGDADPVPVQLDNVGRALRPLSPVRLKAIMHADESLELNWVRRSRAGFAWRDAIAVPVSEESETYQIRIAADGQDIWVAETHISALFVPASVVNQARLAGHAMLQAFVYQVGGHGRSAAQIINTPL